MGGSEPWDRWRLLAPWTSQENLTRWLDHTTWWARPQGLKSQQEMLVDLLEAVAGRFLGRELTLDVRGRMVTLTLGQVRVEGTPGSAPDPLLWWMGRPASAASVDHVHIESSHVTVDESPVGDLTATVDTMRLDYGPTELVTGEVHLEVRTNRTTVIGWVGRALPEWHVQLRGRELVAVRHRDWRFTLLARPQAITGPSLHVDIVGVLLLGRSIMLPRRFVQHRTCKLPAPSDELELVGARVDGDDIYVQLRHAGIRQPVRPDHLRAAVKEGITRLGAKVFS